MVNGETNLRSEVAVNVTPVENATAACRSCLQGHRHASDGVALWDFSFSSFPF